MNKMSKSLLVCGLAAVLVGGVAVAQKPAGVIRCEETSESRGSTAIIEPGVGEDHGCPEVNEWDLGWLRFKSEGTSA